MSFIILCLLAYFIPYGIFKLNEIIGIYVYEFFNLNNTFIVDNFLYSSIEKLTYVFKMILSVFLGYFILITALGMYDFLLNGVSREKSFDLLGLQFYTVLTAITLFLTSTTLTMLFLILFIFIVVFVIMFYIYTYIYNFIRSNINKN